MISYCFSKEKLTEQVIRENVKPLFYTRMKLGEFDPPSKDPWKDIDYTSIQVCRYNTTNTGLL